MTENATAEQQDGAPTDAEGDETGNNAPASESTNAAADPAPEPGADETSSADTKTTVLQDGVTLDTRESKALAIASTPLHRLPTATSATVQPDGSLSITVPDHPDVVNVPDAHAERLPAGTEVVVLDGRLAANVPHGGSTHSVLADIGEEFHHLVARIEGFLRGLTTSRNNVEVAKQ